MQIPLTQQRTALAAPPASIRKFSRKAFRWAVLASSLGCGVLVACREVDPPDAEVIRPVLVERVEAVSAVRERSFPSRARAGTESALSFKVAGQLSEILVSVGETVRHGQVLAELDDRDLRLELKQAEAGYAEANARDRSARSEYARMKLLYENDAASQNQLESAETTSVSARAHLEAQAQAVALARSRLGYAELRAPADGLIASIPANVNENVAVGDTIMTLNAGGRPEVTFSVPEALVGEILRGQPATVRITTLADSIFPAEIVEIGVSTGRSAFPVTARLLEPNDRIRSGMVAETTVRFAREEGLSATSVLVPAYSVAEDSEGRFVFVAKPESGDLAIVERRAVEIGRLTVEGLEIEKGLAVGDRVVVAGLRFLEPGLSVRMMDR